MAKPPLTLWLLNRVVEWDHKPLLGALGQKYTPLIGRRVIAPGAPRPVSGRVEVSVNRDQESTEGELMYEGAVRKPSQKPPQDDYDEYFVPIPTKCVGDLDSPFWKEVASERGAQLLAELKGHREQRFPDGDPFAVKAKHTIGRHFGRVQMNLADPSMGYYELLQRAARQSGAKNVLVGYSQGGTVARYLAFLDEHVVRPERRCIHGIITVQAPNRGSPVAAASKQVDVSRGLLGVVLSLVNWLPANFRSRPIWRFLAEASTQYSIIQFTNQLLDSELDSWEFTEETRHRMMIWRTARKWLSGLAGEPALAFYDLDPRRALERGSVLQALADYPLEATPHGAVIGANSNLYEFVYSLLESAPWWLRVLTRARSAWIRERVAVADEIYRQDVMSFPEGTPAGLVEDYARGMSKGTNNLDGTLEKSDHDFVIPSVSQLLLPITPTHLGNLVNERASHSGGALGKPGSDGRTDQDMVLSLLRKM